RRGVRPPPAPTTAPQTEETSGPEVERRDADAGSTDSGELRRLDPTPVLLAALGVPTAFRAGNDRGAAPAGSPATPGADDGASDRGDLGPRGREEGCRCWL
ncbi:hypothetical protein CTI14_60235, partial [Methylobacterium radiotolerans]